VLVTGASRDLAEQVLAGLWTRPLPCCGWPRRRRRSAPGRSSTWTVRRTSAA